MSDKIYSLNNVISESEFTYLSSYIKDTFPNPWFDGSKFNVNSKTGKKESGYNGKYEILNRDAVDLNIVNSVFEKIANLISEKINTSVKFVKWHLQNYKEGDWCGYHSDNSIMVQNAWVRRDAFNWTAVLYFGEWTGGEVEFMHQKHTVLPNQGDCLVFPADETYMHRVLPIKSGTRCAMVMRFE